MAPSRLALDANDALANRIGPHGLTEGDLQGLESRAKAAHEHLAGLRAAGNLGWWNLPADASVRDPAIRLGEELKTRFENVVVLGIGGSSLGPKAVISALAGPYRDLGPRAGARVFFPDNSDPATFAALLAGLDLARTCFLAVSKSGGTAETLAQLLVIRERLGEKLADRVIAITDPEKGALRKIAGAEGWRTLPVPPKVGGRFSVLTAVGLVPIAAAGVDARAVCAGADGMRARCEEPALRKNPAYLLAALHHLFDTARGRRIHVLFPYADALRDVGDWWVQLWAESLGKNEGVGPTPVRAVGATDQHSMLQLLMEGPQDKLVTFVSVADRGPALPLPAAWTEHPELAYLGGKTMAELIDAERRGTAGALAEAGRPSLTLTLPRVDAAAVGELLFLWEAATAFAGALYGVDPFDQPGVEASKKITQGLLGRKGAEGHAEKLLARPAPDPAFVIG
jgi:glucose-6-phosphate isomerase